MGVAVLSFKFKFRVSSRRKNAEDTVGHGGRGENHGVLRCAQEEGGKSECMRRCAQGDAGEGLPRRWVVSGKGLPRLRRFLRPSRALVADGAVVERAIEELFDQLHEFEFAEELDGGVHNALAL